MLEQALQMSMDTRGTSGGMPDFSAMTEEEQIAYAMQMSMQDQRMKMLHCIFIMMIIFFNIFF